jgi:hypothetical protein
MITPGAAGPPDMGTIINIFPPAITVNGRISLPDG